MVEKEVYPSRCTALVSIWIKPEPFTFGILPVNPPPKLALKFLKKIIPYAMKKKELGFPKLKYSVWRHIACVKLQLPEELAWMYFTTYHSLTKIRNDERISWDTEYFTANSREKENLKSSSKVDTLKFVLLLMIQMINKTNVRSSSLSSLSIEEWPMHSKQLEVESKRDRKAMNEQRYLTFILTHMEDILELMSLGKKNSNSDEDQLLISADCLAALDFIMEGSCSSQISSVCSVTELICKHRSVCGYCPSEHNFLLRPLASWLRSRLVTNPFSISTCLSTGHRLSWPTNDYEDKLSPQKARTSTNVLFAPKGRTVMVIAHLCNETLYREPEIIYGAYVQILRCRQSYIYLLSVLKCVSIYKCRDCTIVLGPTTTCINIQMCKNVTVISISRQLWISDTAQSNFYSVVASRPLLAGNRNDSLIIAPYHTFYPQLEDHMYKAGIGALLNCWDNPLCLAYDCTIELSKSWQHLSPNLFHTFVIPFEMPGKTTKIINNIPEPYQHCLAERQRILQSWQERIDKLTPEHQLQLKAMIQVRFRGWLKTTGCQQEIDSLCALAQKLNIG